MLIFLGMGNRFSSLAQYHTLIKAHGIIAAIVFLFIVPAAIFIHRFNTRGSGYGERVHIYLQVITLLLATVVLVLGWFAVGPERSLTNPHHGIGIAIYALIWVQVFTGMLVRHWKRKRILRRLSIKQMLHQWMGRALALLAIAQVALGLALYGSPTYTFILYAIWMAFLLLLYFILSYKLSGREGLLGGEHGRSRRSETIIQEKKEKSGFMSYLAPVLAGGAAAALLGRNSDKSRDRVERSEHVSRTDPRRGSRSRSRARRGSYVEEDSYREKEKSGGIFSKVLAGAGVLGAGVLAKNFLEKRKARKEEEDYSVVAPDTPSRRGGSRRGGSRSNRGGRGPRYEDPSEISEDSANIRRERRSAPLLPGPGDPVASAAAISAAESRPQTPRPVTPRSSRHQGRSRHDSFSSGYDSEYDDSPSRRKPESKHNVRNGILGGLGLAWLANKLKQRSEKKEQERAAGILRAEREEERRIEEERRNGGAPARFTGDGFPSNRNGGPRSLYTETDLSSELTSSIMDPPSRAGRSSLPSNLGPSLAAGSAAGLASPQSRHKVTEPVPIPTVQPRPSRTDYSDSAISGSEGLGRRASRRRREEEAAAAAAGTAAALAAEEEHRHRTEQSSSRQQDVQSPPVSVKITQHHDKDRNVTLRRLTEEEAAAAQSARENRRQRTSSVGSISASENASRAGGGRYRRDESARRRAERREEAEVEQPIPPMPTMPPLDPPRPAFAGGRKANDSTYYSGTPGRPTGTESVGSHGTWSGMSPTTAMGGGSTQPLGSEIDAAERRRRRRAERNQRPTATVEFE